MKLDKTQTEPSEPEFLEPPAWISRQISLAEPPTAPRRVLRERPAPPPPGDAQPKQYLDVPLFVCRCGSDHSIPELQRPATVRVLLWFRDLFVQDILQIRPVDEARARSIEEAKRLTLYLPETGKSLDRTSAGKSAK